MKKLVPVALTLFAVSLLLTSAVNSHEITLLKPMDREEVQKVDMGTREEVSGEVETIYFTDFETGLPEGWETVDITAQHHWSASTLQAYGGTGQSYYWGLEPPDCSHGYLDKWEDWLETPDITVPEGTSSLTLTFVHRVDTEGPYWDGSVVFVSYDGGEFEWIYPVNAYNADPLEAFKFHGHPEYPNTPGWSGLGDDWQTETFNLNPGTETVRIRYAALSDVAFNGFNYPGFEGIWVDNIALEADGITIFYDDAGDTAPDQMTFSAPHYGNPWMASSDNAEIDIPDKEDDPWWDPGFSPGELSLHCDDVHRLNAALVTPIFDLPETQSCRVRFYVFSEVPDYDGDGDHQLEDIWICEIATEASEYQAWNTLCQGWMFYWYGFGYAGLLWERWDWERVNSLNLDRYAGQSVRLRIRFNTDGNDDGGDGRGLFIDNFGIYCMGTVEPHVNSVAGSVTADCPVPNTGLSGITVEAYKECTGDVVSLATTDENGHYGMSGLPDGVYMMRVVTPLGYSAEVDEIQTTILWCEEPPVVDFSLHCIELEANPRSVGFWKHQFRVATGGKGKAQIDPATLCDYLDLIEVHFNGNGSNPVVVYEPPASGECGEKLDVARGRLDLKGKVSMTIRAKQQLMALLLNVAAGYISLTEIISVDGATVSQSLHVSERGGLAPVICAVTPSGVPHPSEQYLRLFVSRKRPWRAKRGAAVPVASTFPNVGAWHP